MGNQTSLPNGGVLQDEGVLQDDDVLPDEGALQDEGVQLIKVVSQGNHPHHPHRKVVLSWNEDLNEFVRTIRRSLNINEDYGVEVFPGPGVVFEGHYFDAFEPQIWSLVRDQVQTISVKIYYAPRSVPVSSDMVQVKFITGEIVTFQDLNLTFHTVFHLQLVLRAAFQVQTYHQRLVYNGKLLEAEGQLRDYGIPNGALLHLVLRLRGGGDLQVVFRKALRVIPSWPKKLLCLHYGSRKMLSSWNSNFTAFTSNARQLLGISPESVVYFHVTLKIFGDDKMEVDPGTWPALKGSVSDVWVSDTLPFPSDPRPSAHHLYAPQIPPL